MDPRDTVLQTLTPTIMVPKFGHLDRLDKPGHRFLVAADGLWLEIKRAWLYACVPIATKEAPVPIPYGDLTPCVEMTFGKVPRALLEKFVEQARADLPNESAAAIVWNERTEAMRLQPLEALRASPSHITYNQPELGADEHLVVDLHSHAAFCAGFSATDNKDDRTAVKVAGVVGDVDKAEQSYAFRLCALGTFINL